MTEIPYKTKFEPIVERVAFNGATFKTVTWKVPNDVPCKGKIIYVHGFAEDSTLYGHLFDLLCSEGYECFFFDQRGAGETSPGDEEGRTDETHVFSDLDFMIKRVLDASTVKNDKIWLMGHSMGGGIALNYGVHGTYADKISGIIVSAPLIVLHPDSQPNVFLRAGAPIIRRILPNLRIDSKLNYDYITSREDWKEYIRAHSGKLMGTAAQLNDMIERGKKLVRPQYLSAFKSQIPVLIIHGEDDHINWIKGSEEFVDALKLHGNKHLHRVKNGRHSLFIELIPIFDEVYSAVVEFLKKADTAETDATA